MYNIVQKKKVFYIKKKQDVDQVNSAQNIW